MSTTSLPLRAIFGAFLALAVAGCAEADPNPGSGAGNVSAQPTATTAPGAVPGAPAATTGTPTTTPTAGPTEPGVAMPGGPEPVAPVTPGMPGEVIPISADIPNPFAEDWGRLSDQATAGADVDQCVGFDSPGVYRNFTPLDNNANPKEGDVCAGQGNTEAANGSCNVPCGFERKGSPVGNKFCSCAAGVLDDCGCSPLAGVVLTPVAACDTIWTEFDAALPLSFAKQMDEIPCAQEWDSCLTPDLPDACEWTTPKGCICLIDKNGAQVWQCGSTNNWFACAGDTCPAAHTTAGVVNGDVKGWCASGM